MFRASSAHLQEDTAVYMQHMKNIKLCDAKQAKQVYHYKNIKLKLYKNNAAIRFNKTCKTYAVCIQLYPLEDEHLRLETCRGE